MPKVQFMKTIIHRDEPTSEDRLNRTRYADALARLAHTCETPLVIGLHGTWGVGKTSLMKLIERSLDKNQVHVVWFDPWQHQFDENPVVTLVQKIAETTCLANKEEVKKIVMVIAAALGSRVLKFSTGMKISELLKFGQIYEAERFQLRDEQLRLQQHFRKLVEVARKSSGRSKRLIFFIDDLDRCMPEEALRLLEALKLYLNTEGCVYFLAVDRDALERNIKQQYKELEINEVNYLDKIIQLPFIVPPIEPEQMGAFVESMLSEDLQNCRIILLSGLEDNPREVKRFINSLVLNHQLAGSLDIKDYNPQVLALLLIIQHRKPQFYKQISHQHDLLHSLKQRDGEVKKIFDEFLATDEGLRKALNQVEVPVGEDLMPYIYLTKAAGMAERTEPEANKIDLQKILENHQRWLESKEENGERADLSNTDLHEIDLREVSLRSANLRRCNLRKANLFASNLHGADLHKADLREAFLGPADLCEANLSFSILKGADLRGAKLSRANLSWADLSEADLRTSDFGEANLQNANLNGAKLMLRGIYGVNMRGADLTGAFIPEDELKYILADEKTILPDGSKGPANPNQS